MKYWKVNDELLMPFRMDVSCMECEKSYDFVSFWDVRGLKCGPRSECGRGSMFLMQRTVGGTMAGLRQANLQLIFF
jgi:hypothetical protein